MGYSSIVIRQSSLPSRSIPTVRPLLPSNRCVTDEQLVALARQGDTSAFGELVTRHHAVVFRTAFAVCRSREEADEVAQEALIQAWRKLATFRAQAQFKTWLLRIAWRLAIARRRSVWSRLRRFVEPGADPVPEPADAAASPEARAVNAQLVRAAHEEVDRLPPRLREPLLLAMSGDCTFEEMAAILGAKTGTLKWRVMDARQRIKLALAARGYEWQ
jgi:RNA polymerase sigma-70 factor, ECF subfamily